MSLLDIRGLNVYYGESHILRDVDLSVAEFDLPRWTVARDVDLRNWLFGFGAGIRIESPTELAAEHRQWLERALAVYS